MGRSATLLLAAASLCSCDRVDPYTRPGEWHPLGANAANLRAMVADPADLDRGLGAAGGPGDLAATAVARLRAGHVKRLPDSGLTDVQVSGSGAIDSGSSGAGGGSAAASTGDAAAAP